MSTVAATTDVRSNDRRIPVHGTPGAFGSVARSKLRSALSLKPAEGEVDLYAFLNEAMISSSVFLLLELFKLFNSLTDSSPILF